MDKNSEYPISTQKKKLTPEQKLVLAAARSGELKELEAFLKKNEALHAFQLAAIQKDGYTPLLLAAQEGHASLFEWLLDGRHCINAIQASNEQNQYALHIAAMHGQLSIIKICDNYYASENYAVSRYGNPYTYRDKNHATPLSLAIKEGKTDVAKHLLSHPAKKSFSPVEDIHEIHKLAIAYKMDEVIELIEKKQKKHRREIRSYSVATLQPIGEAKSKKSTRKRSKTQSLQKTRSHVAQTIRQHKEKTNRQSKKVRKAREIQEDKCYTLPPPIVYAALSNMVYKEKIEEVDKDISSTIGDFREYKAVQHTFEKGCKALAFISERLRHVIIVVRGTKVSYDYQEDADSVLFNKYSGYVSQVKEFALKVINKLRLDSKYADCQISLSGHSLGGWVAQGTLAELAMAGNDFIRATVIDSPGAKNYLEYVLQTNVQSSSQIRAKDLVITNFVSEPNLVNSTGQHSGIVYTFYRFEDGISELKKRKVLAAMLKILLNPKKWLKVLNPKKWVKEAKAAFWQSDLGEFLNETATGHASRGIWKAFEPKTGYPYMMHKVENWPAIFPGSTDVNSAENASTLAKRDFLYTVGLAIKTVGLMAEIVKKRELFCSGVDAATDYDIIRRFTQVFQVHGTLKNPENKRLKQNFINIMRDFKFGAADISFKNEKTNSDYQQGTFYLTQIAGIESQYTCEFCYEAGKTVPLALSETDCKTISVYHANRPITHVNKIKRPNSEVNIHNASHWKKAERSISQTNLADDALLTRLKQIAFKSLFPEVNVSDELPPENRRYAITPAKPHFFYLNSLPRVFRQYAMNLIKHKEEVIALFQKHHVPSYWISLFQEIKENHNKEHKLKVYKLTHKIPHSAKKLDDVFMKLQFDSRHKALQDDLKVLVDAGVVSSERYRQELTDIYHILEVILNYGEFRESDNLDVSALIKDLQCKVIHKQSALMREEKQSESKFIAGDNTLSNKPSYEPVVALRPDTRSKQTLPSESFTIDAFSQQELMQLHDKNDESIAEWRLQVELLTRFTAGNSLSELKCKGIHAYFSNFLIHLNNMETRLPLTLMDKAQTWIKDLLQLLHSLTAIPAGNCSQSAWGFSRGASASSP